MKGYLVARLVFERAKYDVQVQHISHSESFALTYFILFLQIEGLWQLDKAPHHEGRVLANLSHRINQ